MPDGRRGLRGIRVRRPGPGGSGSSFRKLSTCVARLSPQVVNSAKTSSGGCPASQYDGHELSRTSSTRSMPWTPTTPSTSSPSQRGESTSSPRFVSRISAQNIHLHISTAAATPEMTSATNNSFTARSSQSNLWVAHLDFPWIARSRCSSSSAVVAVVARSGPGSRLRSRPCRAVPESWTKPRCAATNLGL